MIISQCLNDDYFLDKPTPIFHISTEVLRPYYYGWVVNKKSKWRNAVNAHILRFQQVRLKPINSDKCFCKFFWIQAGIHNLPKGTLLRKLKKSQKMSRPEIRILLLDDFIFPGIILTIGLLISIAIFLAELLSKKLVSPHKKGARWEGSLCGDWTQHIAAVGLFVPAIILVIWGCYVSFWINPIIQIYNNTSICLYVNTCCINAQSKRRILCLQNLNLSR